MAGSPKKRARRLAMEKAQREGAGQADGWVEPATPKPQREEADPLVALLAPPPDAPEPTEMPDIEPGEHDILAEKAKAFQELLGLTFDRALDIMKIKPGDENFSPQVLTRQASIIASMLSTTARIDEARLRGRGKNKVAEILAAINAEKTGKPN